MVQCTLFRLVAFLYRMILTKVHPYRLFMDGKAVISQRFVNVDLSAERQAGKRVNQFLIPKPEFWLFKWCSRKFPCCDLLEAVCILDCFASTVVPQCYLEHFRYMIWSNLKTNVQQAARKVCGLCRSMEKQPINTWWTVAVDDKFRTCHVICPYSTNLEGPDRI